MLERVYNIYRQSRCLMSTSVFLYTKSVHFSSTPRNIALSLSDKRWCSQGNWRSIPGMTQLGTRVLRLLGPTRVEQLHKVQDKAMEKEAVEAPRFRSRRTAALLGYLAAERRPIARDFLAALFWPDEVSSKGRSNLRRELHNLAKILPDCWVLDRQAVAFVPSADTTVDLYRLLDLQAGERWDEAVELLGGEFLEGLYLDDNVEFENWLLAERERWRGRAAAILRRVIEGHTRRGRYSEALGHTRRLLQLSPWNERAHRQAMRLLAWTGQRGAALRQFENCKQALWEELGVEPAGETITLYQQIRAGELDVPPQLPAFLTAEGAKHKVDQARFVARERQLAQLDAFLNAALAGQGRVIFVKGGPGRGKTALMDAFARQAMEAHPDLLVARGDCNAYSGVGDPYLPFRDVMAMLSGDVEARWDAGAISRDHAQRLWFALPLVVQALLDRGPHLLDVLVPGAALLSRAVIAEVSAAYIPRLTQQVHCQGTSSTDMVEQSYLFQQVTDVLRTIAREQPLLLILDDIQWADSASIDLLFHLGRRLAGADSRVLIACAYRPEEVALGRSGERHPLAKALSEFKRAFGDVWIELGPVEGTEGREFVDALLDSQPNRLAETFRAALFQRTEGHPLFTAELLRAMQERDDLLKDEHGHWVEGSALDWEVLPARVEAVIEERIDRLDPELQETLAVASVEGEVFTAQVVAEVQRMAERPLLRWLSGELERRHRLVRAQEEVQTRRGRMSRYRFGHVLFQEYLYKRLSPGERRLLHADVATALEKLYEGHLDEVAVQLGHHFHEAGDQGRALPYFTLAAQRAARIHANDEAIRHYTQAIELVGMVSPDAASLAKLHRGRGLACETLGEFDAARADLEAALQMAQVADEHQVEWGVLIDLGKLWASRDYQRTRDYFESALELARRMKDAADLAGSLNWLGNWYANAENPARAVEHHQEALAIFEELGDRRGLANTLDLLGIANLLGGDLSASVGYYDGAIALFQELDDRPSLVSSLMGRGTTVSLQVLLATASATTPPDAQRDIEEAIGIAREIHSPPEEAWADWSLGLLYTLHGQFGRGLEVMQNGLRIATEIGHREWLVGNRFALGVLYVELFEPEEARQQLEQALTLAKGLRSQYWIHHVIGALAAAYSLGDDLAGAQTLLETVLSPQTRMDTMGKRYCWARRAELALSQGDPDLALEIVERLIASAPGLPPGGVITFLWKLKGETLAAMGRVEEAASILSAAIENARALEERFLLWCMHASRGRLYVTMNDQEGARKEYSAAREIIEELAATVQDEALKEDFLRGAYSTLEPR
jgi:adenylate cyclase